jgi:polar amino acid transport system substrate-binding protein
VPKQRNPRVNCQSIVFLLILFVSATVALAQSGKGETYVAGIEAAFPPWAFVEDGEYKGIAVDAMRAIAKNQGIEVEFRDLPWPSLIPALSRNRIDILVTGLNVTAKRDQVIDFSIPWWENDDEILVAQNSDLNAITAMCCGARIGVQGGSTQHTWVEENLVANRKVDAQVKPYQDYVTAVEDMLNGRLDAVLVSTDTAEEFIANGRPVRIAGTIQQGQPQALAVPQGDPDGLLPLINRGILEIYRSGEWAEIVNRYSPQSTIRPIPTTMPESIETYQEPIPGL